jgi:hypothetical protein
MASASSTVDLNQARVDAILVIAAFVYDVTRLIISSVVHDLCQHSSFGSDVNIG